jgi:transposase
MNKDEKMEFLESALGVKELAVQNFRAGGSGVFLECKLLIRKSPCPECEKIAEQVNQYIQRQLRDLSVFGQPCYLIFEEIQYECEKCSHTWIGELNFTDKNRLYTNRYEEYIYELCKGNTLSRAAELESLSYEIVEGIYNRVAQRKQNVAKKNWSDEWG